MWVLQLPTCTTLVTWKVPGFSSGSHSSKRCLLGHSDDGHLVCIGEQQGQRRGGGCRGHCSCQGCISNEPA
jgi:hypothetical protein